MAAQCAAEGFTGPPTALEGRFGFYQAFCGGTLFEEEITRGLGTSWCIPDIFYKPYPANHFTHAGIDAALALRDRLDAEAIESIELRVSTPTVRTIAHPREQKIRPQSGYHGQFSGPFTIAAALLGGGGLGLWLDDFSDEKVRDPRDGWPDRSLHHGRRFLAGQHFNWNPYLNPDENRVRVIEKVRKRQPLLTDRTFLSKDEFVP